MKIEDHSNMRQKIREAIDSKGPIMVDVVLDPMQPILPRVTSEKKRRWQDGIKTIGRYVSFFGS